MMEDLLGAGFHLIDAFPMWLTCDSAKGERVFADCFFDPGKCRLLWKDIGSEEAEKAVLDICSGLGIEGYFPFPIRPNLLPQNRHQGGVQGGMG